MIITHQQFKKEMVALVEDLLKGAVKTTNRHGNLEWRKSNFVMTTVTARKLSSHYDELSGFRIYDEASLVQRYYIQVVGPAGRVTYLRWLLGAGQWDEVEDYKMATSYASEDEACEHCTEELATKMGVLLTVCSSEELEGE